MAYLSEILLAAVLCGAVVTILEEVRGRLLTPIQRQAGVWPLAVLIAREDAAGLEAAARGLQWLRETGRAQLTLVIALDGATPEAEARAALLARRHGGEVCRLCDLDKTIGELTWNETEPQP